MKREFRPGDKVLFNGEVYEVLSKRMGLNFYEIGRVVKSHGKQFITNVRDGLYADKLTLIDEVIKK